jgi:hypothetical protein
MRRLVFLGPVACIFLTALVALESGPGAHAQEGTSVAELAFVGVTAEPLASGVIPGTAPGARLMTLSRLRFAPGGYARNAADDPALALVYVESGTIAVRSMAPVLVSRAATMATPGAQASESIPAGAEVTLQAGDSFIAPALARGEVRNAGRGEAILLVAGLGPVAAATPVP